MVKRMKQKAFKISVVAVLSVMLWACQSAQHGSGHASDYGKNNFTDKTQVAKIRTQMAGQFILAGRLDDAKRQLDMAMAADDRFAPSHDMMGVLLQTEGSQQNLAKADGFFRTAIRLDADFMRAYNNYGVYLVQVGRAAEAVGYFERAGSTLGYEGRIQALENLGFALMTLDDKARAEAAFYRAIDGGSLNLLVYEQLLTHLIEQGNITQAKALLDGLYRQAPITAWHEKLLVLGLHIAKQTNDEPKRLMLVQMLLDKYPKGGQVTLSDVGH